MLASLEVAVAFGEAEVDDVDGLLVVAAASHEVVGLDVAVHEALPVDLLQSRYYLHADLQRRRQRKVFLAT